MLVMSLNVIHKLKTHTKYGITVSLEKTLGLKSWNNNIYIIQVSWTHAKIWSCTSKHRNVIVKSIIAVKTSIATIFPSCIVFRFLSYTNLSWPNNSIMKYISRLQYTNAGMSLLMFLILQVTRSKTNHKTCSSKSKGAKEWQKSDI